MKILTVVGARPQFVKAATISRVISNSLVHSEDILHTGQHFDENMSDVFFTEMDIPKPKYQLDLKSRTHGAMTGEILAGVEQILLQNKYDCVLVYGDTNSTLAGALAAAKLHIPIAHVEAGLRSFNMKMPEEINRILTDRISKFLFCPTVTAMNNLKKEGYDFMPVHIAHTGDVMYDAALFYAQNSEQKAKVFKSFHEKFALCTIHRAENTDDEKKLSDIFKALKIISEKMKIILPLHPRTQQKLKQLNLDTNGINLIDPVGYYDMLQLLKNCEVVLTDSGGLQKEAYFFHKPCITLREETEWVELVEVGHNQIVGTDVKKIVNAFSNPNSQVNVTNLYGDGHTAEAIVQYLEKYL